MAHLDHRSPWRTRWRHVGKSAAHVSRRWRCLDAWQLRPDDQPDLLGHCAGQAVGALCARHRRRRALHQLRRWRSMPTTGRIVWHYQHIPGESARSWTKPFERILIDRSTGRSSVFTMGKLGILWELDRKTRKVRAARAICGYQNLLDVDPRHRQSDLPAEHDSTSRASSSQFCPSSSGFKSLRAMAYHPRYARPSTSR